MAALAAQTQSATLLAFPRDARSVRGRVAGAFKFHRLPERLADALMREAIAWSSQDPAEALGHVLAARLRPAPIDLEKARGILLIGPTQAGKSAIAAKILHAAALVGRRAEHTSAADGLALFRTQSQSPDTLTVMEAEGFNPVNPRAASAFAALAQIEGVESVGIVSALSDAEDVSEIVTSLRFRRVAVTGMDRTRRLGALIAAVTQGARLAHVTAGPRSDDALEMLEPFSLGRLLLDGFA